MAPLKKSLPKHAMNRNRVTHTQKPTGGTGRAFTRRDFLATGLKAGAATLTTALLPRRTAPAQGKPNVLFIGIDDLNTRLGCYGHAEMHTPNIDALAARGTRFNRAYCQFPLCNPSRVSVLTGLRPDTTGKKNNETFERDTFSAVTIPHYFRHHGYHTRAVGKIAHGWLAWSDKVSWSEPMWRIPYPNDHANTSYTDVQALDVADEALRDGSAASEAIAVLTAVQERPFFLALGFDRPHVPFHAPKRYFDRYTPQDFMPPTHPNLPENAPIYALVGDPEHLPDETALEIIHAYAACISYVDAQVGRVLTHLETLGLMENTVIVLWSDHGFHLGEHAKWGKNTLFEGALRTPLIVSLPGQPTAGGATEALVELVDIYPTLCDACELPIPLDLEGESLLPVIEQPARRWKTAAFSQLRRQPGRTYYHGRSLQSLTGVDLAPDESVEGYTMRTERYRYTEWGAYTAEGEQIVPLASELYAYDADPTETVNIAADPENAARVTELRERLHAGWRDAQPETHQRIPIPRTLPWDVNGDGVVDIRDLMRVSEHRGVDPPTDLMADVNRDGQVDLIDFLLVASNLEETDGAEAPGKSVSAHRQHLVPIEAWIAELQRADDGSPLFRQAVANLAALRTAVRPERSVLLPNYPNPFNPETWIPYDLAADAEVTVRITDTRGDVIRLLPLGFQQAGRYRTSARAAYWDGRNTLGELVASGIYFYTLTARYTERNPAGTEFRAVRRMILLK